MLTRRNWFLGRRLRGGESVARLVRPGWRFLPELVHERPDLANKTVRRLDAGIEHDTARSHAEQVEKLSRYASLWAHQRHAAGKRAFRWDGLVHATAYLLKQYLLRGAWIDGRIGWSYHRENSVYILEKYRTLNTLNAKRH